MIDLLTKMVHYELVKVTIDTTGHVEIILDMIIQYHSLSNLIVSD